MKKLFRTVRLFTSLYIAYWHQSIKVKLVAKERLNTFVGFFASILAQLASLVFIWVVFDKIPDLAGWSMEEVALIFAIQCICFGCVDFLCGPVWSRGWPILSGVLNSILVIPANSFFLLLQCGSAGIGNTNGLGPIVTGFAIIFIVSPILKIIWTVKEILFLVLVIISGVMIYLGLARIVVSLTFWTKEPRGPHDIFIQLPQFARYPINIYNKFLQVFLTWVIPFAFTGFYPALFFFSGRQYGIMPYLSPFIGAACLTAGSLIWRSGLRKYEATGT